MTGDVAGRVARVLAWLGLAALPGSGLASAALTPTQDPRLALPASFLGVLPGADGNDVPAHLDLWPDGVYHLHRTAMSGSGRPNNSASVNNTSSAAPVETSRKITLRTLA